MPKASQAAECCLIRSVMCHVLDLVVYAHMNKLIIRASRKIGNQSKLADYLGVSRQFISYVKHGLRKLPKDKLHLINILLGKVKNDINH